MPGHFRGRHYQKRLSRTGIVRMPMWVHIGATWRIRLNRPCAAAMRPYVKLLWPLVIIVIYYSCYDRSRFRTGPGRRNKQQACVTAWMHCVMCTRLTLPRRLRSRSLDLLTSIKCRMAIASTIGLDCKNGTFVKTGLPNFRLTWLLGLYMFGSVCSACKAVLAVRVLCT